MGGKSNAPAPDPRLVEAQIKSMNVQDQSIQELLGLQREMQPLQREQLEFGLESARTAARESADDRQWMLGRRNALQGAQDGIVAEANQFDTEGKREELAGQAISDVNQAFDAVRGQQSRDLGRMGVAPGSGRAMALDGQSRIAQALEQARAGTQTRRQARDEGRMLKRGVADMLAGYPGMASAQTGAGVNYGTAGIGLTNASLGGMAAPITQASSIAGQMGSNATSMFGQQAAREANLSQSEGWGSKAGGIGSLLGGAVQAYKAYKAFSDRRLKTDIAAVGVDERTGLTIYEFRYIANPERLWRGVMADEVQIVMPGAVSRDRNGHLSVNYALLGIPFKEVGDGFHQ